MTSEINAPGVTLRDIAGKLGVSHSTVSRALQDSPLVSEALRRRVQAEARRLGYRPNSMAAGLARQRHGAAKGTLAGALGWINCWRQPRQFRALREFDLYWRGASEMADFYGYRLEEFVCNEERSMARLERILEARNIAGLILPPQRDTPPAAWRRFPWERFCAVRIGYSVGFPPVHRVAGNHLESGLSAFEHLRRLGYERIGFVSSEGVNTRFKAGFLMCQSETGGARIPTLTLPRRQHDTPVDAARCLPWLEEHRPDALLTDVATLREWLEWAGYRIPDDIGLAALSVLDGGADTGIDQNSEEIGRAAVETAVTLIGRNVRGFPRIPREVLVESRWVAGSTVRGAAVVQAESATSL